MLRRIWIILPALFVAFGAAAEARLDLRPTVRSTPFGGSAEATAEAPKLLVWQAPIRPASSPGDAWVEVEVEIYANGELRHHERMEVRRPQPETAPLVSVLARSPEEREVLAGLLERGDVDLEARFVVDGVERERVPLAALVEEPLFFDERKPELLALRFAPPATVADLDLGRRAASADCTDDRNACLSGCQDFYHDCIMSGVCGQQVICETCENERDFCIDGCPVCPPPPCSPTTTTTTRTYQVNAYWTGFSSCAWSWLWNHKVYYDEIARQYQQDTIEVTHHCDGTTSERVIGTSYFTTYCFAETSFWCSFAFGPTWPSC